jgi:hypothetical protein
MREKPPCRVADCVNLARGVRGFGICSMHYQRYWAYGELFGSTPMRAPLGAGHDRKDGYRAVKVGDVRKYEHILVAEKALGRPLPKGARVHHVNEDRSDNRPENLVICPSAKYHALLHMRMEAVKAGKPPHYRRCGICKQYDDPQGMYKTPSENRARHRECARTAKS